MVLAYEAAAQNKSVAPVQSTGVALAGYEGDVIRRRANQADRNSPDIHNGLESWKHEIRGPMRALPDSDGALAAFDAWEATCGYRHQKQALGQQVGIAVKECLASGRSWVQRVQIRPSAYTTNGLMILVRSALDIDRSRGECGLEYDQGASLAGVWFRQPTLARGFFDVYQEPVFVDIRDLAELRLGESLDGDDGEPLPHASLVPSKIADELAVADLRHKQVAANITAIAYTDRPSVSGASGFLNAGPTVTGANGESLAQLAPNSIMLARGVDGVHSPRLDNQAVDYRTHRARIASGMLHTLQTIGGDTSEASMSSLLHSTMMMHRRGIDLGLDMGFPTMLRTILRWFLEAELLAGRNWMGEKWNWLERAPVMINPLQRAEAIALELEMGTQSVQGATRMYGRDPRIVEREREQMPTTPPDEPSQQRRRSLIAAELQHAA